MRPGRAALGDLVLFADIHQRRPLLLHGVGVAGTQLGDAGAQIEEPAFARRAFHLLFGPARDGRDDGQHHALGYGGVEALQYPHVFFAEVDVHEAPDLPLGGQDPGQEPAVVLPERRQYLPHRGPAADHLGGAAGEGPKRHRDAHRHLCHGSPVIVPRLMFLLFEMLAAQAPGAEIRHAPPR